MTGLNLFRVICCAVALFVFPQKGIAQMAMTYDEYKMKLTEQEQRLEGLKKSLLECQTASIPRLVKSNSKFMGLLSPMKQGSTNIYKNSAALKVASWACETYQTMPCLKFEMKLTK